MQRKTLRAQQQRKFRANEKLARHDEVRAKAAKQQLAAEAERDRRIARQSEINLHLSISSPSGRVVVDQISKEGTSFSGYLLRCPKMRYYSGSIFLEGGAAKPVVPRPPQLRSAALGVITELGVLRVRKLTSRAIYVLMEGVETRLPRGTDLQFAWAHEGFTLYSNESVNYGAEIMPSKVMYSRDCLYKPA